MNKLTPQLQREHNLSTHPFYDLWGILRRRSNTITLSPGLLVFKHRGVSVQLPVDDIRNVKLNRKWLYSDITIGTESASYRLKGFNFQQLEMLLQKIQRTALGIFQHSAEWRELLAVVKRYQKGNHYFSSWEWRSLSQLVLVKQRLEELAIDADFISREGDSPIAQLALKLSTADVSESGRNHFNEQVIPQLLSSYETFFDRIESQPLSAPQRKACVTNEDHTLVVAGAGTGKTSTLIGKAGYLLKAGLAQPENILMLAFGNKAAREMAERISERLPESGDKLKATTFHAFGNRIVAQSVGVKRSLTRFAEQDNELRQFIESMLEAEISLSDDYKTKLVKYFVCYSTPGRCEYDFNAIEEYQEFLQSCRLITLTGEWVKSVGELRVANYLYLYSVPFMYEANYEISTATIERRQYKPDFYLPGSKTYIEYLGVDREMRTAPFVDQAAYLEGLAWKRKLHKQHNTRLEELYSYQLSEGTLEENILDILNRVQEPQRLRDTDTLLDELKNSGSSPWQGFIDLMLRFLSLFKEGQFSFSDLLASPQRIDMGRTQAFIALFKPVYDAYEAHLKEQKEMDFSDMIAEATVALQEGQFHHCYDYVLVDEFQDLSGGRGKLLKALLATRDNMRLFAVGDDWQAIYRFNGSDLRFFTRFDHQFSPAKMLPLDKSYRFNNRIHELSSTFVTRNPAQLKKEITTHVQVEHAAVQLLDIQEKIPNINLADRNQRKAEAYHQQIKRALARCQSRELRLNSTRRAPVMLIGRYRLENMRDLKELDLKALMTEFPLLDIQYQTAHSSKGLEANYVLLLGLEKGSFPSAKENDELIDLLLPEQEPYLFAEERRLFYVAVTRARHYVFMIFDSHNTSAFVEEIARMGKQLITKSDSLEIGQWSCPECQSGSLTSRVSRYDKKFYVCSHSPACDYMASACKECSSPMVMHNGIQRICANPDCQEVEIVCRRCGLGTMIKRKNNDGGVFYGCTRYRRGEADCCYENITSEEYECRVGTAKQHAEIMQEK
ncbi:UvrD-helicase domain-containing protein [Pseudescherichia sp.]|uniref:UvrD-helicase domain-containing protein n=1 Tax=Pseudescherichia sp. TaxID=2055881 RepID=UPI0028AA6449|nr:UvrD-helicase domain-containing protein [Pseudescherichia sp.]